MPDDTPNSPPGQVPSDGADEAHGAGSPASSSDAPHSEIYHESDEATLARERQVIQMKKKAAFLLDLLKRFDALVYAELAFLYYLEASLPRFLIRLTCQITLLTPTKIPPPFPGPKPYVQSIVVSNIVCMLLHFVCDLPTPMRGARGYLHGGIWPDFIGQRPPTSSTYLLMLDVFLMGIQFFMLAVNQQSERVKKALTGRKEMEEYQATERGEVTRPGEIESGDLEAAERGEIGRAPQRAAFTSQREERRSPIFSGPGLGGAFPSRPRARTIDSEEENEDEEPVYGSAGGPLDDYVSGNLVLGEFHVLHTIKELYKNHVNFADRNLMAAGYTGGFYLRRAQNGVAAAATAAGV